MRDKVYIGTDFPEGDIKTLSKDYPRYFEQLCKELHIPLNKNTYLIRLLLDWEMIPNKRTAPYDLMDSEPKITQFLKESPIMNYETIILEYGYNMPISEIKTSTFIDNWYDFLGAGLFGGNVGFTPDGKYIFEFSDDTHYLLYTNF